MQLKTLWYWTARLFGLGVTLLFAGVIAVTIYVIRVSADLPTYEALENYQPPVMSRVHAGDGKLIAEYAREHRVFVPRAAIPDHVVQAFISAEDKNFYNHNGLDVRGILRAILANVKNKIQGRRLEGASTLTQQVAENFLLSTDQQFSAKVRKMVIAVRMEKVFSKDKILELYLNEIYLGNRAYGVAAAALNYFGKPLDQLTLSEIGYLAALPKGPANYNPKRYKARAIDRRNWVLDRMAANGYVTQAEAEAAQAEDLVTTNRLSGATYLAAEYFVEEVRRKVFSMYGEDQLYDGGLSIRTTLDTHLQLAARAALRNGLEEYDRRHGYRGPINQLEGLDDWQTQLAETKGAADVNLAWTLAVVLETTEENARIGLLSGEEGQIPLSAFEWARKPWAEAKLGPKIKAPSDVLHAGDIIYVELIADTEADYELRQPPVVNGAIMAMDPHTGRVLALVGGYSFQQSQFDRVVQAQRQIGSAFKPFVYAAALDQGYTPASLVLDAPFIADGGNQTRFYMPSNYAEGRYYGLSTLRLGVEKSRNVMTVRLAQQIGMAPIVDIGVRVGIYDELSPVLAMALGAGESTPWRMVGAYASLVNGGKKIRPTIIDRVQDRDGKTIYRFDERECVGCNHIEGDDTPLREPRLPDIRPQVIDPITAYQITSIMEGVVQRGTATRLRVIGKPVAGKTGTTNDYKDAWFLGFSPDLVVGVYVGFDAPKTLGRGEAGGRVAAPIARDFLLEALKNAPNAPFRIPEGVRLVRVNGRTGELARPGERGSILEAFRPGTEPKRGEQGVRLAIGGGKATSKDVVTPEDDDDLGGLY
ncbi:MAG: penicillin-binding protein [Robiginitomaculum sp.]|nr:MAG: penicillin-binding protein [Robiginitomaculum sp.]